MAKFVGFRPGVFNGRLGDFVGSKWRDVEYLKKYTKPKDADTESQQEVRGVFHDISAVLKKIYRPVVKPFMYPDPRPMTKWNKVISINKPMFDNKEWDPALFKIFDGGLVNTGITGATLAVGTVTVAFDSTLGDPDDKAVAVVFNETTGEVFTGVGDRGDGSVDVNSVSGQASELHAYLVFSQEPNEEAARGDSSTTAYSVVS
jgi:hypothetical protein